MNKMLYFDFIFQNLDFKSRIKLIQTNKINNKIKIIDFFNIDFTVSRKLDEKILMTYPDLKKINLDSNTFIQNINFLKKLDTLKIGTHSSIKYEGISQLKILKLYIYGNTTLDIKNLTDLILLKIIGHSHIDNHDLNCLSLKKLVIPNKTKITNINHLTKLEILNCSGIFSNMGKNGLSKLNLKKLIMVDNMNFSTIPFMSSLISINVIGTQHKKNNLTHLTNLKYIEDEWNLRI